MNFKIRFEKNNFTHLAFKGGIPLKDDREISMLE